MTLRGHSCFEDLADALRAFANGQPLVEIVNSGNWGDALIHAGQKQFLADAGLVVEQVPVQSLQNKKAWKNALKRILIPRKAIITGSGAYRKEYNRPKELAFAARQFAHVVVMPSSYPFKPDMDFNRTVFWRRDALESMEAIPDARFCHDMAFYLQPAPRDVTQEVGVFFRDDAERSSVALPANNEDISAEGTHKTDIEPFLDRIGACSVIHTNRLHVGIAGALLGREVHLYPGNNQKIRSMYEASLEPFYAKVHFHQDVPPTLYQEAETHAAS